MIAKILKSIEEQKITISGWLLGFTGIVFVRCLLEALSSHSSSGIIASDAGTLVHYALFYFTTATGLMLILYLFTKNKNIYKIVLYGLLIIWFAPLFDLITTGGAGARMAYFFENNKGLLKDFLTFFFPATNQGITYGIRVEIFLMLLCLGLYLRHTGESLKKVLAALATSFVFIFIMISLPGVLYTLSHPTFSVTSTSETVGFLQEAIVDSNISHNTTHGTLTPTTYTRFLELGFNKLMSQVFVILSFIFLALWFWKTEKEKLKIIVKNSRPERVGFYLVLLGLGMHYAFIKNLGILSSWADIVSIIVLTLSWYSAWMFAVHINDIVDEPIDAISNSNRPITAKQLTKEEMQEVGYIWLVVSLVGSFSVGYYPFFMNLIFTAAYYIYSAEPLRLKRVPILSSFLISIACLSTVLTGFFFISEDKNLTAFPILTALGILTMFTLASNIRDIKDVEGDRANGINTLPVVFGKNGVKITGILLVMSFLLLPIFLASYTLFIAAIPASIIGYKLATRTPYREKYIFYLYFAFAGCIAIL